MAEGAWHEGELLGFDLETTGVNRFGDVPVSYALVRWADGRVVERRCQLVDPGREIPPEATVVHGITTEQARRRGQPLAEALAEVTEVLLTASRQRIPVAGVNVCFDLTIVDVQSRRHDGWGLGGRGWTGPALDALVLDRQLDRFRRGHRTLSHLCAHYNIGLRKPHDAAADAEAAVGVLRALCDCFPELVERTPCELHAAQVDWHRAWASSFDAWRQEEGEAPLDPRDYEWPVAAPGRPLLHLGAAVPPRTSIGAA